jgi:AcrR family transcriptional regulator
MSKSAQDGPARSGVDPEPATVSHDRAKVVHIMETKTERSGLTLAAILDTALRMAAAEGLESLTIGEVAKRLGLSKSGVFSRIGSREAMQKAVLEEYDRRFLQDVFVPAMREPRGLPRLNTIMRLWLQRARDVEIRQGCIYCAGAFEFDDREGPLRDALLDGVMRWRAALKRTVIQAIDEGHLKPDSDAEQLVFEMDALFTGLMRDARFLRDPKAPDRAWATWERLVRSRMVDPDAPALQPLAPAPRKLSAR